ncbi:MAG: lipocalin-like domain-containing protein [Cyanobacteria bacterium P01_E01_bin.42]
MELHEIKTKLVGTWQLVSTEIRQINTQMSEPFFGDDATGYLLYNQDGYMSAALLFPNQPRSGLIAEWMQSTNLARETSVFYCGRYTIHPGKLIHQIEISSHPAIYGNQERPFEFIENKLLISIPIELGGKQVVQNLLWERVDYILSNS